MIEGVTQKPNIVKNQERDYVIVGSIDHGMQVPESSIPELTASLDGVSALMMETPEEFLRMYNPVSTELLVKASVGRVPTEYLSGNRINEDIGELVLKYAPRDIAEMYVPCIHVRNSYQLGQDISVDSVVKFIAVYKQRFGFIDIQRTLQNYMKVLQYWSRHNLDPQELDHFSYDFEKFVGDVREFELWKPELKDFRTRHSGKVAVCCGDYHVPFVQSVLDGKEQTPPNWTTHIDTRREDKLTHQDSDFLKRVYKNIEEALKS